MWWLRFFFFFFASGVCVCASLSDAHARLKKKKRQTAKLQTQLLSLLLLLFYITWWQVHSGAFLISSHHYFYFDPCLDFFQMDFSSSSSISLFTTFISSCTLLMCHTVQPCWGTTYFFLVVFFDGRLRSSPRRRAVNAAWTLPSPSRRSSPPLQSSFCPSLPASCRATLQLFDETSGPSNADAADCSSLRHKTPPRWWINGSTKDNGFSLLAYSYPITIKASGWNNGKNENQLDWSSLKGSVSDSCAAKLNVSSLQRC